MKHKLACVKKKKLAQTLHRKGRIPYNVPHEIKFDMTCDLDVDQKVDSKIVKHSYENLLSWDNFLLGNGTQRLHDSLCKVIENDFSLIVTNLVHDTHS